MRLSIDEADPGYREDWEIFKGKILLDGEDISAKGVTTADEEKGIVIHYGKLGESVIVEGKVEIVDYDSLVIPSLVSKHTAENRCKMGQGKKCCSYLGAGMKGLECLFVDNRFSLNIVSRRAWGTMIAMGGPCKEKKCLLSK
jgi:hypothetical protein